MSARPLFTVGAMRAGDLQPGDVVMTRPETRPHYLHPAGSWVADRQLLPDHWIEVLEHTNADRTLVGELRKDFVLLRFATDADAKNVTPSEPFVFAATDLFDVQVQA